MGKRKRSDADVVSPAGAPARPVISSARKPSQPAQAAATASKATAGGTARGKPSSTSGAAAGSRQAPSSAPAKPSKGAGVSFDQLLASFSGEAKAATATATPTNASAARSTAGARETPSGTSSGQGASAAKRTAAGGSDRDRGNRSGNLATPPLAPAANGSARPAAKASAASGSKGAGRPAAKGAVKRGIETQPDSGSDSISDSELEGDELGGGASDDSDVEMSTAGGRADTSSATLGAGGRPKTKAAAATQPARAIPSRHVQQAAEMDEEENSEDFGVADAGDWGAAVDGSGGATLRDHGSDSEDEDEDDDDDDDDGDAGEEDDDGGEAESDAPSAGAAARKPAAAGVSQGVIAKHKEELQKLRDADPEFFEFLAKNDAKLLAFGRDASDSDIDEEEEDEDEANEDDDEEADEEARAAADDSESDSATDASSDAGPVTAKAAAKQQAEAAAQKQKRRQPVATSVDSDGEDAAESADADSAASDDAGEAGIEDDGSGGRILTAGMVRSMAASAFEQRTLGGLRRMLQAYRAACYMGETSDVLQAMGLVAEDGKRKKAKRRDNMPEREGGNKAHADEDMKPPPVLKYRVTSSAVFMQVVTQMMAGAAGAFATHLVGTGSATGAAAAAVAGKPGAAAAGSKTQGKGNGKGQSKQAVAAGGGGRGGPAAPGGAGAAAVPSESKTVPAPRVALTTYPGWQRVAPLVKSFLAATVHLFAKVTHESLRLFILRSLRAYIPYLQQFPAVTRKWLKALLSAWSGTSSQAVRLAAFMRVRQAAAVLPYPTIDTCLKGLYLAYVRAAKFMTEQSAPGVLLMANCVAEAYGIDEAASYQHAFIYLRQLALHLRAALTTHTKQSMQNVLSWQFVNCLRVWSLVLSRHATDTSRPLFQLVYPAVQIMLGVARIAPTARYAPLRLHVASMLNELVWSTRVYVPVAPLLLEVLRYPALSAKPSTGAPGGPPRLSLMVKVSNTALSTRAMQDAIVNRTLELLLDAMRSQFYSVALPELAVPVLAALRQFAKDTRVGAWRQRARALVDALTAQSARVASKRAALNAAPADRAALAAFMHAEAEVLREERARAREAAAAAAIAEAEAAAKAAREAEAQEAVSKAKGGHGASRDEEDAGSDGSDGESASDSDGGNARRAPSGARAKAAPRTKHHAGGTGGDEESDSAPPAKKARRVAPVAGARGRKGKNAALAVAAGPADVVEDLELSDIE